MERRRPAYERLPGKLSNPSATRGAVPKFEQSTATMDPMLSSVKLRRGKHRFEVTNVRSRGVCFDTWAAPSGPANDGTDRLRPGKTVARANTLPKSGRCAGGTYSWPRDDASPIDRSRATGAWAGPESFAFISSRRRSAHEDEQRGHRAIFRGGARDRWIPCGALEHAGVRVQAPPAGWLARPVSAAGSERTQRSSQWAMGNGQRGMGNRRQASDGRCAPSASAA
jgi:hypothetical protein